MSYQSKWTNAAAFLLSCVLLASGCGGIGSGSPVGNKISTTKGSRSVARDGMITVISTDNELPVSGAKILIGARLGSPFQGNFLTLDTSGEIAIPADWTSAEPVTIEAPGFTRATFFGRTSDATTFQLKRAPTEMPNELHGETTKYPNLSRDGYFDVGVVFPTYSRGDVTKLELGSLVNADTDTISLFGKGFQVPSNLSVPTQSEFYILPLTLSKPTYRIAFTQTGPQKVAAIHARFKVSQVASDLEKGTPFAELINKFTFVEGSIKPVTILPGITTLSIPVNSFAFSSSIPVTAPDFDPKLMMLSMAVPEMDGAFMISDAKRLNPHETVKLVAPKSGVANGLVVSLLKNASNDITGAASERLSATITTATRVQAPKFLDFVVPPVLHGTTLTLSPPPQLKGTIPAMTYSVLSKVELLDKGNYKLEKKTPQWELYASGWAQSFDLPEWPASALEFTSGTTTSMRWEAAFSAQGQRTSKSPAGPDVLEKVTHVTRNAVDF